MTTLPSSLLRYSHYKATSGWSIRSEPGLRVLEWYPFCSTVCENLVIFCTNKGEMMSDRNFFLSPKASKARLREAENARKNRWDIIKAHSQGQVSRRDLIKMGLFTGAGLLVPISGLSPFARSAFADSNIPTGLPPSPLFGVQAFSTPMPRFDVLPREPVSVLNPAPTAQANTTQQPVDPALGGGTGPIEGRPPGPIWAHQQFSQLPPQIAIQASMEGAKTNNVYNPQVPSLQNSGINPASPF